MKRKTLIIMVFAMIFIIGLPIVGFYVAIFCSLLVMLGFGVQFINYLNTAKIIN